MDPIYLLEGGAVIVLLVVLIRRGFFKRFRKTGVKERVVSVGRGQISYLAGSQQGPSVLLLHGFAADKEHWLGVMALLEEAGYQVVAPDLPGFGHSFLEAEGSYNATALARQLRSLARHADLGVFHLVGHSIGAVVAASYAYAFPMEVASLTLVEPIGLRVPAQSDLDKMLAGGRNPFLLASPAAYDNLLAFVAAKVPAMSGATKRARSAALAASRPFYQQMWSDLMEGERGNLLDLLLPELKVRTLAVFGGKSRVVHPMTAQLVERRMAGKGTTTAIIPDSGHWVPLERPKELAALLIPFFRAGRAWSRAAAASEDAAAAAARAAEAAQDAEAGGPSGPPPRASSP